MLPSSNNLDWTAGLGVEWAFYNNWSARARVGLCLPYKIRALRSPAPRGGGGPFTGDVVNVTNRNINLFTAGVNYKFGWGW